MMLLAFTLDEWRCALTLSSVERAYRAAAVTALPDAPAIVAGIVNVRGAVLPVLSLRQRFRLPEKPLSPTDQFIVAHSDQRRVVLVADHLLGVVDCPDQNIVSADAVLPGLEHLQGIARLKDGMLLIHDLDGFLSLEESEALTSAMAGLTS